MITEEQTKDLFRQRMEIAEARLAALLRSARIWRAWYDGKSGPHAANLAGTIDRISAAAANDGIGDGAGEREHDIATVAQYARTYSDGEVQEAARRLMPTLGPIPEETP